MAFKAFQTCLFIYAKCQRSSEHATGDTIEKASDILFG